MPDIGDSRWQLNLFINLALPSQNHPRITAVLRDVGLALRSLGAPAFTVPSAARSGIQRAGHKVQGQCRAEMITYDPATSFVQGLELKRASFGTAVEDAEQCRAYLSMDGANWRDVASVKGAKVVGEIAYAMPAPAAKMQIAELEAIAAEVESSLGHCCPYVLYGIRLGSDGVYLRLLTPSAHAALNATLSKEVDVFRFDPGDSGELPYQTPLDPSEDALPKDPDARRVLESQVRFAFAGHVGRDVRATDWVLDTVTVLVDAIPSWPYWRAPATKTKLIRYCKEVFRKWLHDLGVTVVDLDDQRLSISAVPAPDQIALRERIATKGFLQAPIDFASLAQLKLSGE